MTLRVTTMGTAAHDPELDSDYRADATSDRHTLLDGLMATFSTGAR